MSCDNMHITKNNSENSTVLDTSTACKVHSNYMFIEGSDGCAALYIRSVLP
jgi:hypothetical protein